MAELVGVAAIVASLVFVGLQMRQAQDISLGQRAQSQAMNSIELTNAIKEHPEIWARGLAGEPLNATDSIVFDNLMKARNDYAYFSSLASIELGYESGANYYATSYGVFLFRNPGARQWFEAYASEDEEIVQLSRGSVILGDWYRQIRAVWAEIEQTEDHGSRPE